MNDETKRQVLAEVSRFLEIAGCEVVYKRGPCDATIPGDPCRTMDYDGSGSITVRVPPGTLPLPEKP